MIKVFNTLSEYNTYVEGGLVSGDLYYVKEDDSVHFQTNNIDGELAVYDFAPDSGESEFVPVLVDATFTANGTYDPADYEATGFDTVTVNVAAPTRQYTALNLNTFDGNGSNFSTMITATVGQTIEIYNPNHLSFAVGQGQYSINPETGEPDAPSIFQNGISSYDYINDNYLEHLYVTNAPNTQEGSYSDYGFAITYYSAAGTPIDGVIYYRVF
jgi:hypothetical protein